MNTTTRSNDYTAPSTSMHIATPAPGLQVPQGYGLSFGLAAVVLSLLGVSHSEWSEAVAERAASSQAVGAPRPADPASRAPEWDGWKATRDLG